MIGAEDRDAAVELPQTATDDGMPSANGDAPPGTLTETALEALLFVAERPLSRREIATLAGVDRATVDARLGDLEVSLSRRGIRLIVELGRAETPGRPYFYGTGFDFLERFGLATLDDLPPLDATVAAGLVDPDGAGLAWGADAAPENPPEPEDPAAPD